jgi:hypothetical protein
MRIFWVNVLNLFIRLSFPALIYGQMVALATV